MLDDRAESIVADALKVAGYRDVWVHSMSQGSDRIVLVSSREVETATLTFGPGVKLVDANGLDERPGVPDAE